MVFSPAKDDTGEQDFTHFRGSLLYKFVLYSSSARDLKENSPLGANGELFRVTEVVNVSKQGVHVPSDYSSYIAENSPVTAFSAFHIFLKILIVGRLQHNCSA